MKRHVILTTFVAASMLFACATPTPSSSEPDPSSSEPGSSASADPSSSATTPNSSSSNSASSSQSSSAATSQSSSSSSKSSTSLPEIDHIVVYAPSNYTKVWAWTDKGNIFDSGWPGENLLPYNDDWKTYEFPDYQALNIIFSEGGQNQTGDLSIGKPGYWWYLNGSFWDSEPDPTTGPTPHEAGQPSEYYNGDYLTEASTYMDFPLWNKHDNDYWTVLSPYTGSRDDFRDETIYFTITTRFYDGDSSNNDPCWDGRNNASTDPAWRGDFKGLIEKMDYIKALGFTAIWITPVVKNASGYDYHGYHAINHSEVDPRYESEDVAFLDVIKAAHARDMKIVLDVVFNHTCNFGEENLFPMFHKEKGDNTMNALKQVDTSLLPSNYASLNGGAQYNARIDSMKSDSIDSAMIYHHERSMAYEQYIEQTGQMAGDCVDLNTEHPAVANYLVQSYGEFIRMGVDAFRIDTMKHISRLTFNNYLWPAFHHFAALCGNPRFHMFGEVCTRYRQVWNNNKPADSAPFYTWKESKNYDWGSVATNMKSTEQNWNDNVSVDTQPSSSNAHLNGTTYHAPDHSRASGCAVIDFPMHWNFQHATDAYKVAVDNDSVYNDATYNVVYVDSHDYGPDGQEKIRYNEGTDAWKENMSLMFTFRGVPCIYYGSEIEFQKGCVIDEGPNIALAKSGRAYFGENLEGTVNASGFGEYTASGKVSTTLNATLSKHLRTLNKIRLKVPALRRGQYRSVGDLSFVRRYTVGGVDSVAAVTISHGATFTGLPSGRYVDLVSGQSVNCNGTLTANVSGQGNLAVYVLENNSTGTLGKIS